MAKAKKDPNTPQVLYKIRNKHGLFSTGGSGIPNFNKKGKIWTDIGKVHSHLAMHVNVQSLKVAREDGWEIVAFALTPMPDESMPAEHYISRKIWIDSVSERIKSRRGDLRNEYYYVAETLNDYFRKSSMRKFQYGVLFMIKDASDHPNHYLADINGPHSGVQPGGFVFLSDSNDLMALKLACREIVVYDMHTLIEKQQWDKA